MSVRARRSRPHSITFPDSSSGLILSVGPPHTTVASIAQIMISLRLYALVLVAGAILAVAYFLLRRKPKTAEDLERERRAWLDRIGRITDGTVIDVQEMPGTRERPSTFLIYQYDVAGVSYEASQDVTYLRQLINLHSCRLGLPTSVRYDPHNPGNSIVLSERWMGLRQ